ncbi:MAG: type IV pilus assembly protein PilM [Candidatus Omnitrophota bacterium]
MRIKFPNLQKHKLKNEREVIGLDIGSFDIKLIKLNFKDTLTSIADFDIEKQYSDVARSLKDIVTRKNITGKPVNISLSGPGMVTRYIPFPKMQPEELHNALKFEAEKHIPFPVNEVILDGCILKDLDDNKMLVLIVAAKKDVVQRRIDLVKNAGLEINLIDIDSLALVNSFNNAGVFIKKEEQPKAIALLDIGATVTNLNILEDSVPRFSRDINLGGMDLTKKISEKLSISLTDAEVLKCNPAERLAEINTICEPILNNLITELRLSFDYYESQCACSLEKIYISGGGSLLSGLDNFLNHMLGIEILHWDPLSNIKVEESVDGKKMRENLNLLTIAMGLGLR